MAVTKPKAQIPTVAQAVQFFLDHKSLTQRAVETPLGASRPEEQSGYRAVRQRNRARCLEPGRPAVRPCDRIRLLRVVWRASPGGDGRRQQEARTVLA